LPDCRTHGAGPVDADIFLTHRDGLEPEEVFRMCGPLQKLLPPILNLVSLPTWLSARANDGALYEQNRRVGREKARFILELLFKRLDRTVVKLAPGPTQDSSWRGYMKMHSYAGASFAMKEGFVEAALVEFHPKRVLDIGANTGHFSLLAARHGASVVAIDSDAVCMGTLWNEARKQSADILPLVVDISRPSPALGWRNRECPGFLDRACGVFDCVLVLAVLHHLLIRERIPLQEVFDLAARLTTEWLVIEYIAPEDEMFRQLTRGQGDLYTTLTREAFELAAQRQFDILRSAQVPDSQRWLYLLHRKRTDSIEVKNGA
jgi:SAM-dependent methyltransferase